MTENIDLTEDDYGFLYETEATLRILHMAARQKHAVWTVRYMKAGHLISGAR
jgi:hypothetical protein